MRRFLPLILAVSTWAAPVHTSVYTDMDKDCEDAVDESSVPQGSDIPQTCKGPVGWSLHESYSVFDTYRSLFQGETEIAVLRPGPDVACARVGYGARKVEWRLRDGRPIALIYRVSCHDASDGSGTFSPVRGEYLVMQPLRKGAPPVSLATRRTKNPNEEARRRADGLP
jgi:hypothetical protein